MFYLGRLSHRLAALWLGLSSLTFYAVWDARFVLLLLVSISFNYGAGFLIGLSRAAKTNKQTKHLLIFAVVINLLLLGYFKYANFFIASTNQVFGEHLPALNIILPLGISFFTFTQIAFLVDVYRGVAREANFIHYLLFVSYFPHLIAGPVLHHRQMMPQFANPATYRINAEHVAVGLTIFVLGLSKKVLIADYLADYATPIFNAVRDGQVLMLVEAWIGALAYTLQLYFDFSGYSDMAIGMSLMFNVRLPMNFDSPYKAINIISFWRRWHMTLSVFLRNYLYFPLGGNRKGSVRRYANLLTTMLLGGLWHGAGWTFIVWGGLHGLYLMINHGWRGVKAFLGWGEGGRFSRMIAGAITFVAVVVAWVFFRADSITAANSMLCSMAGMNGVSLQTLNEINLPATGLGSKRAIFGILFGLTLVWLFPNVRQILQDYKPTWEDMAGIRTPVQQRQESEATLFVWKPSRMHAFMLGLLFILCMDGLSKVSEFLYFRF